MDVVTRRKFLVASGVVGGTALAAGAGVYTLAELLDTAAWKPIGGTRTLVLITLYGGNDGLATVVPYADPAYGKARGELAYTGDQVLRLDDATGLSPSPARWRSSATSAIRNPTAATSGRWTSGRPANPSGRAAPAGSAAGSTPCPTATRGTR
jgi:uncharacterized protein (DUF1501 family)